MKGGITVDERTVSSRIEKFMAYAGSLPNARSYHRKDWDTNYFEIAGKMFGMMSLVGDSKAIITLKNRPEKNEELRELYPGVVIAGYYTNKTHWNSVYLANTAFTDEEICRLIKVSYDLVVLKLPKKIREELTDD